METNVKKITYLDTEIELVQWLSESDAQFKKRLEYIRKLEQKKVSPNEAIKLSNVWYCITFKNCKYNKELHNKVKSFF